MDCLAFKVMTFFIVISMFFPYSEEFRPRKRIFKIKDNGLCEVNQYRCKNEKCIQKSWYCDGGNDCGDNSDENSCAVNRHYGHRCPTHYPFFMCESRCIPLIWKCDGNRDCPDGSDEFECLNGIEKIAGVKPAQENATLWMINRRQSIFTNRRWGIHSPRIAIALHFAIRNSFNESFDSTSIEIAYEVENHILSSLLREKQTPIHMNELALYIHALLVTCMDPREFHEMDLVSKLRQQVDHQLNYTSPQAILALCNANDEMTANDVEKLINVFNYERRPTWTSAQALAFIALSCIVKHSQSLNVSSSIINDMSSKLKKKQNENGGFENILTTALIAQAIFASETNDDDDADYGDWDMEQAIRFLVKSQHNDGSFGTFLNTYYVLPVLHQKSLLSISSSHCASTASFSEDETEVISYMTHKIGKKISVKYSLWIGDQADLIRSLIVRVVENSSFFDIMKLAESLDSKYSFNYSLVDSKPFVYYLNGFQDDPESERFWFFHKTNETGFPYEVLDSSPADVFPKDEENYIMWYRRGHWTHNYGMALENKQTPSNETILPESKENKNI